MLPMFLLGLPAGALADILDRRRLLLVVETIQMLLIGALALLVARHRVTAIDLLVFTFLQGVTSALVSPTWQAIVPQLVGPQDLSPAVALNSAGINISRAVGPALTGLVIAWWGMPSPFLDRFGEQHWGDRGALLVACGLKYLTNTAAGALRKRDSGWAAPRSLQPATAGDAGAHDWVLHFRRSVLGAPSARGQESDCRRSRALWPPVRRDRRRRARRCVCAAAVQDAAGDRRTHHSRDHWHGARASFCLGRRASLLLRSSPALWPARRGLSWWPRSMSRRKWLCQDGCAAAVSRPMRQSCLEP